MSLLLRYVTFLLIRYDVMHMAVISQKAFANRKN